MRFNVARRLMGGSRLVCSPILSDIPLIHGYCAIGFDRLMTILCKAQSIRDVIAFPKASTGTDLLFKSPAPIPHSDLKQYGIQPYRTQTQ